MTDTEYKQTVDSQKTLHTSPSRASYGVSIVRILEKIECVIIAPQCIKFTICPQDANDLEDRYNQVADQLGAKYNQTREAKERADRLRDRASEIYLATYDKLNRLRGE